MSTELTTTTPEERAFELVQRQAKMLAASTLIPKEFQGNMANCAIGLNIAKRLGADPFMVLQNIDIIHGRPSFRASFLIAMVNASGRFSPLQFRLTGEGQERQCVAYATNKETGEIIEGPPVSMAMAKAEGWATKNGSKWQTMPELMLRYRSAAFFARSYAPDITLGMQTDDELQDTVGERNVTPIKPAQVPAMFAAALPQPEAEPPAGLADLLMRVESEKVDDAALMKILIDNAFTEAQFIADVTDAEAGFILSQWDKIKEKL